MRSSIQVPYGYNVLFVGSVRVHTAKLRVKTDYETVKAYMLKDNALPVGVYPGKNGNLIITWTTSDLYLHRKYQAHMNQMLAEIMHNRIALKYGETVSPDLEYVCDVKPTELDF